VDHDLFNYSENEIKEASKALGFSIAEIEMIFNTEAPEGNRLPILNEVNSKMKIYLKAIDGGVTATQQIEKFKKSKSLQRNLTKISNYQNLPDVSYDMKHGMSITDFHYETLQDYISTGCKGDLTDEMINYLIIIELVRNLYNRFESKSAILSLLSKPPYNLSVHYAIKAFEHSINMFHLDNEIHEQAWANVYADKLDELISSSMLSATTFDDIEIIRKLFVTAMEMRSLACKIVDNIPKAVYDKPIKIYSLDSTDIQIPKPNRTLVAKLIDQLPTEDEEKERLLAEAGIKKTGSPLFMIQDAIQTEN